MHEARHSSARRAVHERQDNLLHACCNLVAQEMRGIPEPLSSSTDASTWSMRFCHATCATFWCNVSRARADWGCGKASVCKHSIELSFLHTP